MPIFTKNGKIVTNSKGRIVMCDSCPCGSCDMVVMVTWSSEGGGVDLDLNVEFRGMHYGWGHNTDRDVWSGDNTDSGGFERFALKTCSRRSGLVIPIGVVWYNTPGSNDISVAMTVDGKTSVKNGIHTSLSGRTANVYDRVATIRYSDEKGMFILE